MMKKMLILMLVLGLASMSQAALTDDFALVLSGGNLNVVGLNASAYYPSAVGVYDSTPTIGSHSNAVANTDADGYAAGDLKWIQTSSGTTYDGFDFIVGDSGLGDTVSTTVAWFTLDVTGINVGDMMDIYDYSATTTYVGQMAVTPEPMTIALLGLGGLFLRRRK